jgi:hypothetical protein
MDYQEATSEPAGNAKKPAALHLMPHNKTQANRIAMVSFVITRYLTLGNTGWSLITLHYLFMFSVSVSNCYSLPVYLLAVVIQHLACSFLISLHLFLFDYPRICFCFVLFVSFDFSVSSCCSDTRIVFQVF